ncbi:Tigger transposable element-derived protein 4-like [Oopsacas minuta]|uniref:Tigger transposable element-derived protein 4-like n=1 Tax=Oopsacas minuta TaxID=111878 RepID=A0AAV7KMI4_9METZ|nr:Tigger transposable element-derived protein 4-like [Oopsacas minuta]
MEKAQFFANAMNVSTFIATTGFIDKWKRRHSIEMKQISGEEKSVSEENIRPWLDLTLPDLLLKYIPENIYNADETALFLQVTPERTLTFKGEKCSGSKKQKDPLTVLVGTSLVCEKLPLLAIGKSKSPRCFRVLDRYL